MARSITGRELALVVEELRLALLGARLRKVAALGERGVALVFRAQRDLRPLLLSLNEGVGRAHLLAARPVAGDLSEFARLLRERLEGLRLERLTQRGEGTALDRVLDLEFSRGLRLIAELGGAGGNLLLLDPQGRVVAALAPGRLRDGLALSAPYGAPPAPPSEVAARLAEDPLDLASLPADGARSRRLALELEAEERRVLSLRRAGDAARRLRQATKQLRRREAAVAGDLERAQAADTYRRWGELLQSARGRVRRGAAEIEVPDWFADGAPLVKVPLEPKLDLGENIARLFGLYRKLQGATEKIAARLDQTRRALAALAEALPLAEGLQSEARAAPASAGPELALRCQALMEQLASLERAGFLEPERAPREPRREPAAAPYWQFRSASGRSILVGKDARQNDVLTLSVAHGNDLWLHARDWAGSHVVVRLGRGEEIDEPSLLDAATLAAWNSKARGQAALGGAVEVAYTHAKHIRKPKGAPPGSVTLGGERVITLRLEKDRLERLLAQDRRAEV